MSYPLTLQLQDKDVLVVGGGPVAARRVPGLLDAGARVTLVAPYVCEDLADLIRAGRIDWHPREYRTSDMTGKWLVLEHSGDGAVQDRVKHDADASNVFCVKGGDKEHGSAWVPATVSRGGVSFAVSAGGRPREAAFARDSLASALDTGAFSPWLAPEGAGLWSGQVGVGAVALIGGGPGGSGLITTRGRYLLSTADVVVVDRLAPRGILPELTRAQIIDVGKAPGHHATPQSEINRLLVEHALMGRNVARLKGGDPFVLGRGGEELEYCREFGVPVEVVPGVTSAVAVPAAVGVPVTHRGLSRGFTVVTGHEELGSVPTGREHTLVLLMAVSKLALHAAMLIDAGRDPECPVAIIEDGFGPHQRLTTGPLEAIGAIADARGVKSPAVVVIGDVATLARS